MQNPSTRRKFSHYYGDTVRVLFLIAAIIMLVTLPSFSMDILTVPTIYSVAGILVLGLAAGLTNPRQKWDAGINTAIAAIGFLVFESVAVASYQNKISTVIGQRFFLINLFLGFIFLIALYFAVKTYRGLMLTVDSEQDGN